MKRKKILAISGSTRKNSTNERILKAIVAEWEEEAEVHLYEGIDRLPHFNPDLDGPEAPEAVQDFRKQIEEADGVLFCTPEYVFSLPGSLKNAIDWNVSTTLFSGKPVAVIVASASGKKALESLTLILTTIEAVLPSTSALLIQGVKGKINGEEITDEETRHKIQELMRSLVETIDETNKIPTKYT